MTALKVILAIAAVIAALFVILYIARKIKRSVDADRVLQYEKRDRNFIYKLLDTTFSRHDMMWNVMFPDKLHKCWVGPVDAILVRRGGVAVIHCEYERGYIDNPYHGSWCQYSKGGTFTFPNPFESINDACTMAIRGILRDEEIYNIPIHNLIVFIPRGVKFKNHDDSVFAADNLLAYVQNHMSSHFITKNEIARVEKALRKYCRRLHMNQPAGTAAQPLLTASKTGAPDKRMANKPGQMISRPGNGGQAPRNKGKKN